MTSFWRVSLFNLFCVILPYTQSIEEANVSNSSGQYYVLDNSQWTNVQCEHQSTCSLKCNHCIDFTFIANSTAVIIECTYCEFLKVYAQYAQDVIIQYKHSKFGHFHLEYAQNIDIMYSKVYYSTIYAQYAQNVMFEAFDGNSGNIFYLDYVSKEIHFEYVRSPLYKNTIYALYAHHFTFTTTSNSSQIYSCYANHIYCPSHDDNVCVIDGRLIGYQTKIFISNVSDDVRPLNVTANKSLPSRYSSTFSLWCNKNDHGFYESFTYVTATIGSKEVECRDIISECCYLNDVNDNETNDIICDDDDTLCIIDCTRNDTDCNNGNIYASNATIDLYVICEETSCYGTIINCPTNMYSLCNVSCFEGCDSMEIKYNTNNEYMVLECLSKYYCSYLEISIDSIQRNYDIEMNNIANIVCYHCYRISFIANTEINLLNITCSACSEINIHAQLVENLEVNCNTRDACNNFQIYGKTDAKNAIQINCKTVGSCEYISIFSDSQYQLDYISMIGFYDEYDVNIFCAAESEFEISTDDDNGNQYFCDPFSGNWSKIYYCNDGETCSYNFNNTNRIIIYGNNANSLSISCTDCSEFNIYAQNASIVSLEFYKKCEYIKLNGNNINTFDLQCDYKCNEFIIDIMYSDTVVIDTNIMYSTEINAVYNTNIFKFRCRSYCDKIGIVIPSNTLSDASIQCDGDFVEDIYIYSLNGNWNDINDLSIISCDNTSYGYREGIYWHLYCPSSVNLDLDLDHQCTYINGLQTTFCYCDRANNQHVIDFVDGGILKIEPYSIKCIGELNDTITGLKSFQDIFGVIACIISLSAICIWCIISIKHFILRFRFPIKYNEIMYIEPPSLHLLRYIYFSDFFVWFTQLYILVICGVIRSHMKNDICSSITTNAICNETSFCHYNSEECIFSSYISVLYIFYVICFCIPTIFMPYCKIYRYFYRWNVDCTECVETSYVDWNDIIQNEYYQRTFWRNSILIFFFYCLFFFCPLLFYFVYDEDEIHINIKWYDIFPVMLLLITNEVLKKGYRMLAPYDLDKHILYIITNHFGENITSIVISFVGGECDESECNIKRLLLKSDDSDNNGIEMTETT